jgi:hypothetical protein
VRDLAIVALLGKGIAQQELTQVVPRCKRTV